LREKDRMRGRLKLKLIVSRAKLTRFSAYGTLGVKVGTGLLAGNA
jgi:hypothetical protein